MSMAMRTKQTPATELREAPVLFLVGSEPRTSRAEVPAPYVLGEIQDAAYRYMKRLLDLVLGSLLLCCSLPVIIAAAIAIRMESRGNPLFIQTRVGLNGRPFKMFKLRGMYIDARQRFPALYDYSRHDSLDFYFHNERDPRITAVGSFIRKTSIDELPNFLNVVLGNMSLVGPRPEIPEVSKLYGEHLDKYLSVKPGVTCTSKASGRDKLTKEETIRLDIAYIENRSTAADLKILWATVWSVLGRRNVVGENPAIAHKPDTRNDTAEPRIATAGKQVCPELG